MQTLQEQTSLSGLVRLDLYNSVEDFKNKKILSTQLVRNTVMNVGKAQSAKLLGGLTSLYVRFMAIGTDSTAASATQTALLAEITTGGGSRTTVTASSATTTTTDDTVRFVATWTFTSAFTIREIALFDSATLGVMFARTVVNQSVTSGQVLQASWDVKQA